MNLLAADAEYGGKLAVKAGFCGMFKIVIEIGNTAARALEILAARTNCLDYLDVALRIALADGIAVGFLAVLFEANPKSVGGALPLDDFYFENK